MIGPISAAAAGVPFNLPVSGAFLWLDASNPSSFTYSSGSVVSQWKDLSGNEHKFTTASVSNQPNRNGTQNSKSTVVFDGTNDYLKSTTAASNWKYMHDGTPNTFFIVFKNTAAATPGSLSTRWVASTDLTSAGTQFFINTFYTPIKVESSIESTSVSAILQNDQDLPNSGHNVYTFVLDPNNATDNNKLIQYQNTGSALNPFVSNWVTDTANTGTPLYLGTGYDAGIVGTPEYMFEGEIAEVISYKTKLSDTNRTAVVDYLKAKWGTP